MSIQVPYLAEHELMADSLIREMDRNDGLAPLDVDRFWAEDEHAQPDPFAPDICQPPFGARLTAECVYDELGVPLDMWRYYHDEAWRLELNRAYNDRAECVVGIRLLPETMADPASAYPPTGTLADVFEARNLWHDQSWWLQPSAHTREELTALLDRVERKDIRAIILPEEWKEARDRLLPTGIRPPLYRGQRGPVTFATSVFGAENMVELILETSDLAARFRDVILRVMLEMGRMIDEEAGYAPEDAPHGFGFADDNCCLLTAPMYDFFAAPILEAVFARYSPNPDDRRFQHSDSPMEHLLPSLARLGLNGLNLGPTVMAAEIRKHLPDAVIYGQIAPFTYSRNERRNLLLEFLRDFSMLRETRGLVVATAGSINNGTRLETMRLLMAAVQRFGRYA